MDTSSPLLFHLPTPLEQERRAWTEDRRGYLKEGPLEDSRLGRRHGDRELPGLRCRIARSSGPGTQGLQGRFLLLLLVTSRAS